MNLLLNKIIDKQGKWHNLFTFDIPNYKRYGFNDQVNDQLR